jgi:hypothetical protein
MFAHGSILSPAPHSRRVPTPGAQPAGFALAVARIVDCRRMAREDEAAACCPLYEGAFSWILEDVCKIEPISVKGSLGIYEVNVEATRLKRIVQPRSGTGVSGPSSE